MNDLERKKIKVLTLGVFHFEFPNRDVIKVTDDDKIDVFDDKYQNEINLINEKLMQFKPTKIVIEQHIDRQNECDQLYQKYLNNDYNLTRNEIDQIGFRLAKKMGLNRVYCVDEWGKDYEYISKFFENTSELEKFKHFFSNNPDCSWNNALQAKPLYKTKGILAELKRINSPQNLINDLGWYFTGIFKYETSEYKKFGTDFVSGWWFNRNLRIFRNIQKITSNPEDRILVIYGKGHMNLLNIFFNASPEYELLAVNDFLN